jgi:hypothetical protein
MNFVLLDSDVTFLLLNHLLVLWQVRQSFSVTVTFS